MAGNYYGDGRPFRLCRLEIASDGDYTHTCFDGPSMTQSRGRVQLGGKCLALLDQRTPLHFATDDSICDLADSGVWVTDTAHFPFAIMRIVRWGQRQYLLGRGQLLEFCIATAEKAEPREQRPGVFYLHEGDEVKAVSSSLPAECQKPNDGPVSLEYEAAEQPVAAAEGRS